MDEMPPLGARLKAVVGEFRHDEWVRLRLMKDPILGHEDEDGDRMEPRRLGISHKDDSV
jgi:hypothetical protein